MSRPIDTVLAALGYCRECDTPFPMTRGGRRYCGERCRKRAEHRRWRHRNREIRGDLLRRVQRLEARVAQLERILAGGAA